MIWLSPFLPPQENAHFSISESLIAAIELMKCNMMSRQLEEEEEDSDKEIQELKQKIRIRRQQIRTRHLHPAFREMGLDSECFLLEQLRTACPSCRASDLHVASLPWASKSKTQPLQMLL